MPTIAFDGDYYNSNFLTPCACSLAPNPIPIHDPAANHSSLVMYYPVPNITCAAVPANHQMQHFPRQFVALANRAPADTMIDVLQLPSLIWSDTKHRW